MEGLEKRPQGKRIRSLEECSKGVKTAPQAHKSCVERSEAETRCNVKPVSEGGRVIVREGEGESRET